MTQPAIAYTILPTSLGRLLVAGTPRGVCLVRFGERDRELVAELAGEFPYAPVARDDARLAEWAGALVERVEGRPASPAPPLDVSGSRFQRRVWDALRAIPPGCTRTYGEVAAQVGHAGAARAVGTVCARNPVPLVVPCHRVVPAAGGVGRYGGGPWRKAALLERESAERRDERIAPAGGLAAG